MYDLIIIGAGISGTYLANKFKTKYKILILEQEQRTGGVWYQNKWEWLRSDTTAYLYCPSNRISMLTGNICGGMSKNDILRITDDYVRDVEINYNSKVSSCNFTKTQNWIVNVNGNEQTYYCKNLIVAAGIYQQRNFISIKDSSANIVHSSEFHHKMINCHSKIAIVGSRESATQIIWGIQKMYPDMTIDWYGKTFTYWYFNPEQFNPFHMIIKYIPYIVYILVFLREYAIYFFQYYVMILIASVCRGKNISLYQAFYNDQRFRYHNSQAVRPVVTPKLDFSKINVKQLNHDTLCELNSLHYTIIISATGYNYDSINYHVPIYDQNNNKLDVDVFYLSDYVLPNHKNLYFCLPIAFSSTVMLEKQANKIEEYLKKNLNEQDIEDLYIKNMNKINNFMAKNSVSKDKMIHYTRHPTFLFYPPWCIND